jgi:hypothetical protein
MSLKNNIQGIQAMTSAVGVTGYKADILKSAETLGININIHLSSTERRMIADALVEEAKSSLANVSQASIVETAPTQNNALAVDSSAIEPLVLQIKEVGSTSLINATDTILEDYALNILSQREAIGKLLAILKRAQQETTQMLVNELDAGDAQLADELDTLITRRRAMHNAAANSRTRSLENFAQRLGVSL